MRSSFRSRPHVIRAAVLAAAALIGASCASSDDKAVETPSSEAPDVTTPVATDAPTTTEAPPETEPASTEPAVTEPPATDPPVTEAPVTGVEFADGFGPYSVGVQTITVADTTGGGRDLTVDVWFPLVEGAEAGLTPQQYTLLPEVYYQSPTALAATAETIATDGPFPLVVYSHGSGGLRYIDSNYTEALASNGYVVAAPDHTGNTAADRIAGAEVDSAITSINRPNDITRVIEAFLNPESTETVGFVAAVDPGRIAVTGHSFGGFTAYAMASGFSNDVGEFVADERVGAIIALAPATQGLSDDELLSIEIPALVMAGTADITTPIDPNVTRPWNLSASSPSYRVDLTDAEHSSFTDVCAYQTFLPTLANVPPIVIEFIDKNAEEGCKPDDMPIARAQSITNTFAVSFLDSIFKDGTMITPDEVADQPDLAFQAE